MKPFHIIAPIVLFGIFGATYLHHSRTTAAAEQTRLTEITQAAAQADLAKAQAEQKARDDAARRAAEKLAGELKAQAELDARWAADDLRLRAETDDYIKRGETLERKIKDLEVKLGAVRASTQTLTDEAHTLARSVELADIEKRNTELETQRLTEILVSKATGSSVPPATQP